MILGSQIVGGAQFLGRQGWGANAESTDGEIRLQKYGGVSPVS